MRTHTHLWLDRSFLTRIMLPALVLVLSPALLAAAEARSGEQIYKQLCISCHGATGGGTKDHYPHPLMGDRSVAQLTKRIARSMPKDNPGTCVGDDAQKVAAYIYDAFYSRAAQARRQGPRVELTRLTVRQYRNVLADLVGSFRTLGRWDDQHGLHAEYRSSRRFRNANPGLVRLDPEVHFDFGTSSPDPEKLDPHQFSARWEGSVLAPETGDYEFIIRTDHAARLWVNNLNRPLVDAWVKSGKDTEYRASISLLGGRAYPLRLEFSKAKQGVDDSKKTKEKPPVPASIALLWKLPRRAEEVIPQRDLTPNRFPETFVVTTPFPPDDRSLGYERGTSISREWDQAATDAAIETAGYVVSHLQELAGAADNSPDRAARLREFCRRFAERAFRRPLTPQQQQFFIDRQFQPGRAPEIAVKRVVLLVLNAPQFLYQELDSKPDAYDVASRLSFGLWDSLPDQELLQAAAAGRLATREQVAHQVERMMSDLRTRSKVHEFFLQWLKIDQIPELSKDPKLFAGFDPALASDLRTSLDLFVEDVVWSPPSDFRRLLLGNELYLNGRLAQFYGAHLPPEAPFQKVSLESQARAGVLTHPYLLSVFAYTGTSSPIHRGVFLARNVLGVVLRPPPQAFTPLNAALHPELTTRQRVALQTSPQACQACHGIINPLGFTLEHFDAVGRYRDQENGRPIDGTGAYLTRAGQEVKFTGARDLATFLAGSEDVHDAFVERLFHYLVKQPILAYGPGELPDLRQSFARHEFNIRQLMVEIMATSALTGRQQFSVVSFQSQASVLADDRANRRSLTTNN